MPYTRNELLDALRAYADEHGEPPRSTDANECDELPSATAYVYNFESWNAAIEAAGLEPRNRQRSDEELLDDLRGLAATGQHPSRQRVDEHEDMASAWTYANRFGSWSAALREAGLPAFESG